MKDRIAVLIPCYNESKTIEKVVTDFRRVLPEAVIYVYDNNSSDGTAEIAKESGAQIIIITDKLSSDLAPYATLLFTVPVDSDAFFNSMIAAQFVAETILDCISQKARGIEKRLKKIDQYLDKLGNY